MAVKLKLIFTGKRKNFLEPLRAKIVLGDHSINKGDHLLSAECASAKELEEEIDSLKSQLEKFVRIAQNRFSARSD